MEQGLRDLLSQTEADSEDIAVVDALIKAAAAGLKTADDLNLISLSVGSDARYLEAALSMVLVAVLESLRDNPAVLNRIN